MVQQSFSLSGKAALVIGAAGPVGRALAVAMAEAGADVAVSTTTGSQQEEVAANSCANEVWALKRKGFAATIDAASESEVDDLVQRAVAEMGRLDILVNAHDLPFAKPLTEITPEEWRRVVDVNLTGVYLACRAAAEPILSHGSGRMINVVSLLAERGMVNGAAYCSAQAGVMNHTRALALEWAKTSVTVNAIGAGWTERMALPPDEEARPKPERYLPGKRLAKPEEIAGIATYLASDAAAYLTGQVVWIEGGALSHV